VSVSSRLSVMVGLMSCWVTNLDFSNSSIVFRLQGRSVVPVGQVCNLPHNALHSRYMVPAARVWHKYIRTVYQAAPDFGPVLASLGITIRLQVVENSHLAKRATAWQKGEKRSATGRISGTVFSK
jgi:hypothetical protein